MKRTVLYLIAMMVAALHLSGCGSGDDKSAANEARVPVEVMPVRLGEVVQTLTYYGDIKAENEVKVYSKIPDRIEVFFVEAGDRVTRGAPLARIVATTIAQAVRQAEAGLVALQAQEANLRAEYERFQVLYHDTSVSKQQYDAIVAQYEAVQAQVEQARAAVVSARSQLLDASITAPIAGVIGKRYCEAGDMASPALPLVSVVQMDRVKMVFSATEKELPRLAVGQKAEVAVSAHTGRSFAGRIHRISPVLDPLTRMAEIEVLLDNPGHLLKPGMYAQVKVTTGVIKDVIVVPRHAILESTSLERIGGADQVVKNYFVFVADSGVARQRKLGVLYMNHEYLAVDAGLALGEKLVVLGQHNLREGTPLIIVREEEAS